MEKAGNTKASATIIAIRKAMTESMLEYPDTLELLEVPIPVL